MIEELGLADRVNAGLRLLDAAGIAEPWAEKQKKFWEKPVFGLIAAGLAAAALIACAVLAMQVNSRDAAITKLKQENHDRPVTPSTRKVPHRVIPVRNGPPSSSQVSVSPGEFAELKMDLSWTKYQMFRVTIVRTDQGRVAEIDGLTKDSNGDLRISINAGAFGPGNYDVELQGLNMRREGLPMAWFRFSVNH